MKTLSGLVRDAHLYYVYAQYEPSKNELFDYVRHRLEIGI